MFSGILIGVFSFLFGWQLCKNYYLVEETSAILSILSQLILGEISGEQANKELDELRKKFKQ